MGVYNSKNVLLMLKILTFLPEVLTEKTIHYLTPIEKLEIIVIPARLSYVANSGKITKDEICVKVGVMKY